MQANDEMTTKTIDLKTTATNLDELLELLQNTDEILLTKGDVPLARLSSLEMFAKPILQRTPGLHAGTTWVSDDFDDPLPDEFWLGEA